MGIRGDWAGIIATHFECSYTDPRVWLAYDAIVESLTSGDFVRAIEARCPEKMGPAFVLWELQQLLKTDRSKIRQPREIWGC